MKQQLLIVDAYNMIGNWPELNHLKQTDRLPQARDELISMLTEYKKITGLNISLVFDAMYVPGNSKSYRQADLEIIWTSKDQTADSYIEKYAGEKQSRVLQVTVATSDQQNNGSSFRKVRYEYQPWNYDTRQDCVERCASYCRAHPGFRCCS
jgi:predicted RNA-binding protein with PIN domain